MSPIEPLHCFATATPGIESLTAGELGALGIAAGNVEPGGVDFTADATQLADALLWLRTANRVTVRLASFRARTFAELERHAAQVDWARVMVPGIAVHFRVTSLKSRLYHQGGIAERLERSAVAAIAGTTSVRAPADAETMERDVTVVPAVQRIVVRVLRDEFVLSADACGALLHRRGYRQAVAKAPVRESLAAALLMASGWTTDLPLVDPMCGAGTIAIEAAFLARRMAPGRARRFAAERWPGLSVAFEAARRAATARELPAAGVLIAGYDRDTGAIVAAQANAERAGVAQDVNIRQQVISNLAPDEGTGWIVTNPPYGARIGERAALRDLYATVGTMMRQRRPGWHVALLGADRMLEGQLGLRLEELFRTTNGGLPVRGLRTIAT